ncbi:unnamed protein product [Rotaria magnacalcarata]|uniref:Uncharacterized protein n=2 Tax=Rotaria magnacalcarata TaxID=392030 RepID=A0A816X000_9BILA|nr:unnamed protein product [Rotaria magnacalcarata]CAF2140774.1 unnamed protein product [Rotaria magnacalcarata]CAF3956139.1 unnamed protein product [Rotaria magnacalcarata]CAF4050088.1 unnamed protein product [Rotaria magnacalcarata]
MSESLSLASTSSSSGANNQNSLKIIVLGDSAVGKSKLLERFLVNAYVGARYSTYAVNIFKHTAKIDGKPIEVEFWDTAGQEKFDNIHHSYFHQAHACIMIFDATRKVTYKNLDRWYTELRDIRPHIPCLCAVNKIDSAMEVTKKSFSFPKKHDMPLYFVSAANGTNVVRLFRDAIRVALAYQSGDTEDFIDQILRELEDQRTYDNISQTVDSSLHHYENHNIDTSFLSDTTSSNIILKSSKSSTKSTCFGNRRNFSNYFFNHHHERYEKKYKFWLNLLLAEEWNYFYLLKDKFQPYDEQEKHINRINSTSKLSSILIIYLNSFVPYKSSSSFNQTLCLNHYERLYCLFNSLVEAIIFDNERNLCLNIIQRITYLINKMKDQQYEGIFIQFPSYNQRTLTLSSIDNYKTLNIMSKDKHSLVTKIQLHLILGINIQQDKHLLVLSVEQPQGSNAIHNFHFAHADRSIINEWYQLLDKYVKQAKCDYMNKYHEYRI